MGLIYVTFPMSPSREGFMSLLNDVNSPKVKFIYMEMIYVLFINHDVYLYMGRIYAFLVKYQSDAWGLLFNEILCGIVVTQ